MNNEAKNKYYENIQKDINNTCIDVCFKNSDIENCLSTCFDKYIKTLNKTHKKLGEIGYENQSLYSYKLYPEQNYWFGIVMSHKLLRNIETEFGVDRYSSYPIM